MVMPRARSNSRVSVCVVPLSTLPTDLMTPVSKRMRSVRLVLPASTCARIPILIIAMQYSTPVEEHSDQWTLLQRLPHGILLVPFRQGLVQHSAAQRVGDAIRQGDAFGKRVDRRV